MRRARHRIDAGHTGSLRRFLFGRGVAALVAGLAMACPLHAQDFALIRPGSAAVSAFSGTSVPDAELPAGADPVDETFIDTGRATLRIFDVGALGGPPSGQLVGTPPPFEVLARQIGQVFALSYDDGRRDGASNGVPNLYAGATSLYGLRVVTADEDGDGRPERRHRGKPGARFMAGQFGEANGGSPGAIWKIDGMTGALSLFATVPDSGPGIADIAFDKGSRQFFVSDLDTGLIHRIGADGTLIDTFDHGLGGRPASGVAPVADDGTTLDIQTTAFDSEDPSTWGFTPDERRVWALAAQEGRLYYAVASRAEIWSIGLNSDGSFAADPRRELTVKSGQDYPVTDIAFDGSGFMYLAQRGPIEHRYDESGFAGAGGAEVLRYRLESPDDPATPGAWEEAPEEYAIGFPQGYRQAAGGIDLQYGYDGHGNLDLGACGGTLAATGERLRENPALEARLAAGGPAAVHGVQFTAAHHARPRNEPPFGSWFVDFDGRFEDRTGAGRVGDVEVWHSCDGGAGMHVENTGDRECEAGQPCMFEIRIRNDGRAALDGVMRIADATEAAGLGRLEGVPIVELGEPFGCPAEPTALPFACDAPLSLAAGESRAYRVTVVMPDDGRFDAADGVAARNCVAVLKPGTLVIGAGTIVRGADAGERLGRAVACHDFRISRPKVKLQCATGATLDVTGSCICPRGTEPKNGACRKIEVPPVRQCKLLPGQIRTESGNCMCPRGTELSSGACRKVEVPPVRQCKLLPGQIRTESGRCICPKGTELRNGACRKAEVPPVRQCKLLPGQIRTEGGRCICPKGTELRNGACRKVEVRQRCPAGTIGPFPSCRKVRIAPGLVIRPRVFDPVPRPRGPQIRQPTVRQPVVRQPVTRTPVVRQPVTRTPVVRQPVTRAPVLRKHAPRIPPGGR